MTVQNTRPTEPIITRTDVGYTIVKQKFSSNSDYDIAKVGGWSKISTAAANTAAYSEIEYDQDNRVFTWSGLTANEEHIISLTFLDAFALGSNELIQAQYLFGENSLDLVNTTVHTKEPITITSIDNEVDTTAVANPFSDLVFTYTGEADQLLIQVQKVGSTTWTTIFDGEPTPGFKVSLAGGTYTLRYVSKIGFSDGTIEEFEAKTYPSEITVESGLGAPIEVSGVSLTSYKSAGSSATYDLRIGWAYPADPVNQNKKRNFTVTVLPNPTLTSDYATLDWSVASEEIAINSPYVIKPFPYKTAYVVRIGVMGWGTEASDYVYVPVFISKDSNDSIYTGYLVPSDNEVPVSTKIQIDDEHIRAYSVFDPANPSLNKLMFEVDAATGNVVIGRVGGAYNNTNITTAPFIFDSVNNKLQVSGRVITDQIESASYVLTWIDGDTPSLRTAGKNGYGTNAPGIWMGYTDLNTFMFDLGNNTNYMRWDGSNLTISGTVRIGNDGRTLGQAQKQVFIYKRSSTGAPPTPTGGTYASPAPAGWSLTVPTGGDELYMSSRLLTSDGMPPQDTLWATPSLFQPGSTGTVTSYTWIKYADDINGTGLSDDPTDKDYIGIAVNKSSATESTNPADYTWSRLTGGDGVQGPPGDNGITYYTWIKYSPNADGSGLTDAPDANTQYIGISTNQITATESTNPLDYVWSKFKGDTGVPGSNGVSSFKSTVFIRQDTSPGTPVGGSYASPLPSTAGWSDGIPSGTSILWASTRIFTSTSGAPQQLGWTAPVAMTNTADLDIRYSSISVSPGDPTTSPGNWSTTPDTNTVWLAQRTRSNSTWSSWNVTKIKGETGAAGQNGKVLVLTGSTQTITFNTIDVMTPSGQSVSFSVSRQNITAATAWSAVDDSGANVSNLLTGISNTSATLEGSALQSRKSIRVTASADGLSDTVSIAKVKDGTDSTIAFLTNEAHGVPANRDGVVSSFTGASGNMKVFRGTTDVTSSSTFSVASSNGATGAIDPTGFYNVTAMSADVGTVVFRAVSPNGVTIDKTFTVTKVKAGIEGKRGAGQYSALYEVPVTPITAGMASAAKAACPGATPTAGDIVTLYSSNSNIVPVSLAFNASGDGSTTSSWDIFSLVINGNLLVNGTVGADKINVNELFAQNAIISGLLQVGEGSTYTLINGGVGGLSSFVGGTTIFSATPTGGFLNGNYLGAGTVGQDSLSPELQQWIAEQGNGGQSFEFGGSATFAGNPFASGTYTLSPTINLAAGNVTLNFSYGGKSKTVISAGSPGVAWISLRYKKNNVNLHANPYVFNGLVEELSTNEWYCALPEVNHSVNFTVPEGPGTFSVQVTYSFPEGGRLASLGAFNAGAFQQPSGVGVTNMNLNDLLDVELASVTNGQTLVFDSATGKWKNSAGTSGGGAVLTFGNGLIAGSYNGSAATTINVNTSTGATPNSVVARDASGNFAANTIYSYLDGTARDANKLKTLRSISASGDMIFGWNFDGSANVVDPNARLVELHAASYTSSDSGNLIPVIGFDKKGRMTSFNSVPVGNATGLSANGTTVGVVSTGIQVNSASSFGYVYLNGNSWIAGGSSYMDINHNSSQVAKFASTYVQLNMPTSILSTLSVTGGAITCNSTITGTDCIATSDIRVKTDIRRIEQPIEKLKKLRGGFTFNRTDMDNIRHAGVIANYVQEALPEAIFVGEDGKLTVSHSSMLGLLVEICTEQQKRIEELERRLNGDS